MLEQIQHINEDLVMALAGQVTVGSAADMCISPSLA
jgi:hypothetical protein